MTVVRAAALTGASALLVLTGWTAAAATRRSEPEPAVRSADMGGRYAVLREKGKDTGCMITFDERTRVGAGFRAALAPACRDQGIVVFDPVSWHMSGTKLILTARKGHSAQFELQAGGTWQKDGEGKALALKKF